MDQICANAVAALVLYMEGESEPSHPSDWRRIEPKQDDGHDVVFACAWLPYPVLVDLCVQTALTVILLGFNNDRAGRMAAHV